MALTIFSWGYWGWGNATKELVRSFDLAEEMRGFKPPIFVDCRIRRQGRAKGFVGDAFRDLVGLSRYCWMDDLGHGLRRNVRNYESLGEISSSGSGKRGLRRLIHDC